MVRKIEDIELDIAEVKQLILSAKRPNNQTVLAKHLASLKTELEALAPPKIQKTQIPETKTEQKKQQVKEEVKPEIKQTASPAKVEPVKTQPLQKNITYTPLTKYSWDQEGKKVKIYFSLENVGNQCKTDQIDVKFQSESVELKIRGYKNSNLIFAIRKLCGPIEPETSTYLIKTNTICLTLIKKDSKHWQQLHYKEDALSKDKKEDKEANPGDSLMNMMKKMYEEGDQNMKRTIAEAWTKAQDKSDKGNLGGLEDFGKGGMGGLGGFGDFGGKGMGDFPGFKPKK